MCGKTGGSNWRASLPTGSRNSSCAAPSKPSSRRSGDGFSGRAFLRTVRHSTIIPLHRVQCWLTAQTAAPRSSRRDSPTPFTPWRRARRWPIMDLDGSFVLPGRTFSRCDGGGRRTESLLCSACWKKLQNVRQAAVPAPLRRRSEAASLQGELEILQLLHITYCADEECSVSGTCADRSRRTT